MKSILISAFAVLSVTVASAEPAYLSAGYALPGCQKGAVSGHYSSADENIYLMGFCGGVLYALAPRIWAGCDNPALRTPVTIKQYTAVVARYIEARPERWNELFMDLAAEAMLKAWPCHANAAVHHSAGP